VSFGTTLPASGHLRSALTGVGTPTTQSSNSSAAAVTASALTAPKRHAITIEELSVHQTSDGLSISHADQERSHPAISRDRHAVNYSRSVERRGQTEVRTTIWSDPWFSDCWQPWNRRLGVEHELGGA